MAAFKIKYPGYLSDLRTLISSLGSPEQINSFQRYMRDKAKIRRTATPG